ncbi:hypothetical protein [Micromonospora chersina]|uniref:hypothetical protein n=1 Tax=Micromonospora chersina TaxID=47854 RepID=UPI003714EBE5
MAVSYVGVTSGNSAGGTSTSFVTTLPAGWAAGDVAVLSGHVRGTSLTMSTPAGWTLVPGPTWPVNQGTNSRAYAWFRVLQDGDAAPTITNSGAMTGGWSMTVYRGADTASPIGQVGTSAVSGTSLTMPALTGVLAGSALAAAAHAGVSTGTIPSGLTFDAVYTEVADHATSRATSSANQRMAAAYRLIGSAGSYGGESVTVANAVTSSMVAVLVEVKQAASADATVAPDGLSVPAAVGAPAAAWSGSAAPDGVAAGVALGAPAASWAAVSAPDGVPVGATIGSPSAVWSAAVAPGGLAVPLVVGDPSAQGVAEATAAPAGLSVPVAVGGPSAGWSVAAAADGVAVPLAVGVPSAVWDTEVAPDGLLVAVALGAADVSLPGQVVVRPDVGAVARPGAGVVTRPDMGVVPRATSVVVRPDAGVVARP